MDMEEYSSYLSRKSPVDWDDPQNNQLNLPSLSSPAPPSAVAVPLSNEDEATDMEEDEVEQVQSKRQENSLDDPIWGRPNAQTTVVGGGRKYVEMTLVDFAQTDQEEFPANANTSSMIETASTLGCELQTPDAASELRNELEEVEWEESQGPTPKSPSHEDEEFATDDTYKENHGQLIPYNEHTTQAMSANDSSPTYVNAEMLSVSTPPVMINFLANEASLRGSSWVLTVAKDTNNFQRPDSPKLQDVVERIENGLYTIEILLPCPCIQNFTSSSVVVEGSQLRKSKKIKAPKSQMFKLWEYTKICQCPIEEDSEDEPVGPVNNEILAIEGPPTLDDCYQEMDDFLVERSVFEKAVTLNDRIKSGRLLFQTFFGIEEFNGLKKELCPMKKLAIMRAIAWITTPATSPSDPSSPKNYCPTKDLGHMLPKKEMKQFSNKLFTDKRNEERIKASGIRRKDGTVPMERDKKLKYKPKEGQILSIKWTAAAADTIEKGKWADAFCYVLMGETKKAARALFHSLFSEDEICNSSRSGRGRNIVKLDTRRCNAIVLIHRWMDEHRTAFPYSFEVLTDVQLADVILTPDEKSDIESVFTAETNQARQKQKKAHSDGGEPSGTKRIKMEPT